jgi:hypothetical protein
MLQATQFSGATIALNSGALAIGSTTSQYTVATAVNYLFKGVFGQRATDASEAFLIVPGTGLNPTAPNSFVNLAIGDLCHFAIVVRASDNALYTVQGPVVPLDQLVAPVPAVPEGFVLIGSIKVSAAAAFTVGTTALNAASITTTYFNLGTHPGRAL